MSLIANLAIVGLSNSELDSYISDIADYQPVFIEQLSGLIARLVDSRVGALCVSDAVADWQSYVVACKTNPATRRIPVVLFLSSTDDPPLIDIDLVVSSNNRPVKVADVLQNLSVNQNDDLTADCAQPLPPKAQEAIQLFNQGEYYKQHDLLEALWMETDAPVRDLYQAILQVGIAYYQVERTNYRGALKMLLRALQWLNKLPDVCQQVDIALLRSDANRVRVEVENVLNGKQDGVDLQLLKSVKFVQI